MAVQSVVFEIEMPTGGSVEVVRHRFGSDSQPRVAIVSGIRGDAPEGMRIALAVMMLVIPRTIAGPPRGRMRGPIST